MKLTRKILVMLAMIVLTTVVAVGIYFSTAYNFTVDSLKGTFKSYGNDTITAIEQTEPISILLMGVDTGSAERTDQWVGNSDSMMVVTVNPKTKETTVTSLERDILISLTGPEDNSMNGVQAKLNAAYASGGAEMAIMTVEDLLDIDLDYYVQINMQGLVDLVDAVGGITVTNDFDFPIKIYEQEPEYTAQVQPGTHKINGDQALVYARMRYDDPEGDYGRQRRQRIVIQKIMEKLLAYDSLSSYQKVISAVSDNVQTDIKINSTTIPSLLGYKDALENVSNYQLHGQDAEFDGGSYQILTSDHLLETQNRIKSQLGQATSTTLKTTAILYEDLFGTFYGDDTYVSDEEAATESDISTTETTQVSDAETYNQE
ncbi:glycopolymer--peptidoglycan transferase LytR [Streptococcus caprae]|uniref:LCP family protein n=1 Tax=Streptococcus caprae TaxID=1640501 RepID=A0ABV8CXY8_9STRE